VTDVLRASVELPTIVFTALLAIAGCMWVLSFVGLLDLEVDAADGLFDDALEPLNLSEVPATLLLTVFGLAGWFISVLASVFLLDSKSGTALALWSVGIGIAAALSSLWFVTQVGSKLALIFVTTTAPSKLELLGRIAEVRSATVTETAGRGEATWPDGTVSTVDLRTTAGSGVAPGELKRGDMALLVDWDESTNDFIVGHVPAELTD
jgi:cation transport ATPase